MRSCGGLGALALSSMLQAEQADPLAPKKPHHTPTAKSVIFLFMEGGPSHIDLFDPKPELQRLAGQPMPASFGKVDHGDGDGVEHADAVEPHLEAVRAERDVGLGLVSERRAACRFDMAMFRSCWADGLNHVGSVCQMNTGSILAGRPSMGSWVTYGLGSANQNLPTFVILTDAAEVLGGREELELGIPAGDL